MCYQALSSVSKMACRIEGKNKRLQVVLPLHHMPWQLSHRYTHSNTYSKVRILLSDKVPAYLVYIRTWV